MRDWWKLMKLISVLLPEKYVKELHELVRSGAYPSRSAAVRAAVRDLVKSEVWLRRSHVGANVQTHSKRTGRNR